MSLSMYERQEPEKIPYFTIETALTRNVSPERFLFENPHFPKSRAGKNTRKMPLLRNRGAERRVYENRAYEAGKDHRYMV